MNKEIRMSKKVSYITDDGRILLLVLFEGRVQGVCFRMTCNEIAGKLCLGGYVVNNPDGEVEALFKGDIKTVNLCLSRLSEEFQITNMRKERMPIDFWESDAIHLIDYGRGVLSPYTPFVYSVKDNEKSQLDAFYDRDMFF